MGGKSMTKSALGKTTFSIYKFLLLIYIAEIQTIEEHANKNSLMLDR